MKWPEPAQPLVLPLRESTRQREFPVVRHSNYFAHAAVAPLPSYVRDCMKSYIDAIAIRGQFDWLVAETEIEARQRLARMLSVSSTEIAFAPSTSAALGMVAAGLHWRDRDNVVVAEGDFPSNVWPWVALASQGVEVRLIPRKSEALNLSDIEPHLDKHTRLVALSSVHYVSGRPVVDLCGIGQYLNSIGVLTCVDAIQSLGAQPVCGRCVDFVAADGHKWLLGPKGLAVLYVRESAMDQFYPPLVGWRSSDGASRFAAKMQLSQDARRYEPGTLNEAGLVGLAAALRLVESVGAPVIDEQVRLLRQDFARGVRDLGGLVVGTPDETEWGGIVSFFLPNTQADMLADRLSRNGYVLSVRPHLDGADVEKVVRFSPHFYNTAEEVASLLSHLRHAIDA